MERWLTEKQAAELTGFTVFWFRKKRGTGGGHQDHQDLLHRVTPRSLWGGSVGGPNRT